MMTIIKLLNNQIKLIKLQGKKKEEKESKQRSRKQSLEKKEI